MYTSVLPATTFSTATKGTQEVVQSGELEVAYLGPSKGSKSRLVAAALYPHLCIPCCLAVSNENYLFIAQ